MASRNTRSNLAVRDRQNKKPPARKSHAYLASLHAATLRESESLLPAEIIARILDFLPVRDLMRFAQTSKRMREMVYDDTRWVLKLQLIGCWNESDARRKMEEAMSKKIELQQPKDQDETSKSAVQRHPLQTNGTSARRKGSATLFDAGWAQTEQPSASSSSITHTHSASQSRISVANLNVLEIFKNVRSVRGQARQEYGKIYAALGPYYLNIVRAQSHSDLKVFRDFSDPEDQARMLAQLQSFCLSDTTPGWHQREELLESIIAFFENAALREFEQGYMAGEVEGRMRRYAHVLVTLNGGASAIDLYIHNHALMTGKEKLGQPLACLEGSASGNVDLAPSRDFFQKLSYSLNQESQVIDRVFPSSVNVMKPFLDRVAEDIVSEYVNLLLDEAHIGNKESYLKLVAGIFEQSLQLVKSLTPPANCGPEFHEQARLILVRCFVPHIDLYLKEELDFLKARSTSEIDLWEQRLSAQEASTESFFMSNVNRQAEKKDFMTSFKQVIMMPVNVLPTFNMTAPFTSNKAPVVADSSQLPRVPTPSPASNIERSATPRTDAPKTELAAKTALMNSKLEGIGTLFSLELALSLVHMCKASLERTALFIQSEGDAVEGAKHQCREIFIHLVKLVGIRHVKTGFDKAVEHLSLYNAREANEHGQAGATPLMTFLELVNVGDLIQQMIDVFYGQQLVAAKLVDTDDFLDPAVKQKKQFEQVLDQRVAAGLNQGIDVLMDEVEYICATTQSPTDFSPANTGILDIGPTMTAQRVVELVSSHTSMLIGSADKNVLDVFNQEVGLRLFNTLCKHIKRQRISTSGAIKLISDTNHYFAFVQTLRNKELLQYFMALRELSQIFLVDGKDAKELATIIADGERYRGVITVEDVLEFAERRADWYQIRSNVEKAMFGIGCVMM